MEVRDVIKEFDGFQAVDRVSFTLGKGEVVGFLGPNGAGKTTTMRMLVGYLEPTEGQIRVMGMNPVERGVEVRAHVGYLPENNPLYPDMYVREFLLFVARVHRLSRPTARVKQVIEMVGLTSHQNRLVGQLSRGYRQRVGLAHALLHEPEILILDEPTSGLDPVQVVEIRSLIRRLGEERTILLSTHIIGEVEQVCTRVLVIHRGRLVADGPVERLRQWWRGMSVAIVELKEEVSEQELATAVGMQVERVGERIFRVMGDKDPRERVYHTAVERGWTLLTLRAEEHSLEDVFRQLTAEG